MSKLGIFFVACFFTLFFVVGMNAPEIQQPARWFE
tara:strand:+ start:97 stop:201 length:105 start_codon:yes stop_codon:yes gene_type:complete